MDIRPGGAVFRRHCRRESRDHLHKVQLVAAPATSKGSGNET